MPVFIVAKYLFDKKATEVTRDAFSQPKIGPSLGSDECAEKLAGQSVSCYCSRVKSLVYNCGGMQQTCTTILEKNI